MGPGERQTPARDQGVENILGPLWRAVGSANHLHIRPSQLRTKTRSKGRLPLTSHHQTLTDLPLRENTEHCTRAGGNAIFVVNISRARRVNAVVNPGNQAATIYSAFLSATSHAMLR